MKVTKALEGKVMPIMECDRTVPGAEFVSFYQEGMAARIVPGSEERFPDQIGLLPVGEEDRFLAVDSSDVMNQAALTNLAEWYNRRQNSDHHMAMIGKMGLTLSAHELPYSYVVLALEEPARYSGGLRIAGNVVCVIDVLDGPLIGRYYEQHQYEAPPTVVDTAEEARELPRAKARPLSLANIQTIHKAGRTAGILLNR